MANIPLGNAKEFGQSHRLQTSVTAIKEEIITRPKKRPRVDALMFINFPLLHDLTCTPEKAVEFCKSEGLLPQSVQCPNCSCPLDRILLGKEKSNSKLFFMCQKVQCRKSGKCEVNAKQGTWFEGSDISLQRSLILTYAFASKFDYNLAMLESSTIIDKTSEETVYSFYKRCRELCTKALLNKEEGTKKIGGANYSVEIDETKFRVTKSSHGEVIVEKGQLVLGGVCRETNEYFLVPVADTNEATFMSIIQERVEKGSTIYTDCFQSYEKLNKVGYKHWIVDHRKNFVDPKSGASVNKIQSLFWAVRRSLPDRLCNDNFLLYLNEYIWRRRKDTSTLFWELLKEIAFQYPGPGQKANIQIKTDE